MTTAPTGVQPGWYPCPQTPGLLRWHDGSTWTTATSPTTAPAEVAGTGHGTGYGTGYGPTSDAYATHHGTTSSGYAGSGYGSTTAPSAAPGYAPTAGGYPGYAVAGHGGTSAYAPQGYAAGGYVPGVPTQHGYAAAPPAAEHGPRDAVHWIVPVGRSGVSIAAGYVGLVAMFLWALGPVAVWLGVLGLRKARTGGHGSGRSWFGIVVGTLASLGAVATLLFWLSGGATA